MSSYHFNNISFSGEASNIAISSLDSNLNSGYRIQDQTSVNINIKFLVSSLSQVSYLGKTAGTCSDGVFFEDSHKRKVLIKNSLENDNIEIGIDQKISNHFLSNILENIFFYISIRHGAIPLHSVAYGSQDSGTVLCGWGGIGKTDILLSKLSREGWSFGDEWNLITNNNILPVRKKILLMYYNILNHPQLASPISRLKARVFSLSKKSLIQTILCRLHLALRFVNIESPKSSPMNLREVVFLIQGKSCDYSVFELVTLNFEKEKNDMVNLSRLHNLHFKTNIDILDKYKSTARNILENIPSRIVSVDEFTD